jgi:hypothetical protein
MKVTVDVISVQREGDETVVQLLGPMLRGALVGERLDVKVGDSITVEWAAGPVDPLSRVPTRARTVSTSTASDAAADVAARSVSLVQALGGARRVSMSALAARDVEAELDAFVSSPVEMARRRANDDPGQAPGVPKGNQP